MIRRHPTLIVFVACVVAMFGALAWVTHHALRLESQQREARAEADLQERVRLALWRMDPKAGALLARESARPYFEHRSFFPAERAYTKMLEEVKPGEVLVPSPLLVLHDRLVRLHFQVGDDGMLTSPQAPTGNLRDLAEATYVSPTETIAAEQRLVQLASIIGVQSPEIAYREADLERWRFLDPVSIYGRPVPVLLVNSAFGVVVCCGVLGVKRWWGRREAAT